MMRSLWTAASGMKAQQTNVDTIANNLSNVNTTGYKTQQTQFKTLLYQTMQEKTTTANGQQKPTTAQVGLGTRVGAIDSIYTQGAPMANDSNTALYISGTGFFGVKGADGGTYYTRNGDFTWAINQNGDRVLADSVGNEVLSQYGTPITMDPKIGVSDVSFGTGGEIAYKGLDGRYVRTGESVGLFQFANAVGLEKKGSNLLAANQVSGPAQNEATTAGIVTSKISQGYLEGSNVNVADEMVNMIIAQRAYELNSKAITTSDTMLEEANNLKR